MRRYRIRRSDYDRVLVTETLPYETPVIFSNDGLYVQIKTLATLPLIQRQLIAELVLGEHEPKASVRSTVPFLYKIRKDSKSELRRLALLHPRAQWKIRQFYESYEDLLLYHCSHSPASIRAPAKVAGSFFLKGSAENVYRYKADKPGTVALDGLTRHSPTFFAYSGHDRLYRFFESRDYFELEKRYAHMRTLDVSKCFDSIYTHTMSWAVKDKEFTKKNLRGGGMPTFAHEFDALMQYANHGETNGIVIGPEVSRIFAEIVFQDIDLRVIAKLRDRKDGLVFGTHYAFRRYVDDLFIFAETPDVTEVVYRAYADGLSGFNLHANSQKSVALVRPFVTDKSRLIHDATLAATEFLDKFLQRTENYDRLRPLKIHRPWKLTRSLIESIKGVCSHNDVNYDSVAGFLIAVVANRIKKLVAVESLEVDEQLYLDALLVLIDVLYFLYQVSPSVSASYKACTSIILAIKFTRKHLPAHEETVSQRIFELTESVLASTSLGSSGDAEGFLFLEKLNIVLAARELGPHYVLSELTLNEMFFGGGNPSYFSIVSCLFYARDDDRYAALRKTALETAEKKLAGLSDLRTNAEKALLLLDLLACPYVPIKTRTAWTRAAFRSLGLPQPSKADVISFLSKPDIVPLYINWKSIDLLNALERKELKRAY